MPKITLLPLNFLPSISYFQKLAEVDIAILQDLTKYNQLHPEHSSTYIQHATKGTTYKLEASLKDPRGLELKDIKLEPTEEWRKRIIQEFDTCYTQTQGYREMYSLLMGYFWLGPINNLAFLNYTFSTRVAQLLGIETIIKLESTTHTALSSLLTLEESIKYLCESHGCTSYVNFNPSQDFSKVNLTKYNLALVTIDHPQTFNLSILDLICHHGISFAREFIQSRRVALL